MAIKELNSIIKKGEGINMEFKEKFSDKVIEGVVAFANNKGGKILIGVKNEKNFLKSITQSQQAARYPMDFQDGNSYALPTSSQQACCVLNSVGNNKEIKGINIGNETIIKWTNEIKNKTHLFLTPEIYVTKTNGKKIAIIEIQEFPLKPVAFKDRYYKRVGNSNQIIPLQEVAEIYLRTKNSSWDFLPDKSAGLKHLNEEKINFVKNLIEKNLEIDLEDNLNFLRKYSLIVEEKGVEYPTYASLLLFSKKEKRETDIQIGLFQTETIIKKSKIIRRDLISQVKEVLDFIESYILKEYIFTGKPQREEKWQYPIDAIREIVVNAIVHRDYLEGTHSQFKIFPDKIEFWNAGKLPSDITIEEIKKGIKRSYPRNKLIAEIFRDAKLIERYGSGVKRVIENFEKYELTAPSIKEIGGGFEVIVESKRDTIKDGLKDTIKLLSSNEKTILKEMKNNLKIPANELSGKLKINIRNIEKNIEKLKEKRFIKRVGSRKTGYWEILRLKKKINF